MKISEKFTKLKDNQEKALIIYLSLGDPNIEDSTKAVQRCIDAGADIIELGLPFSDPIADGGTIQRASQRSLSSGMNTDSYFESARKIHEKNPQVPLVCMTYYNLPFHFGLSKFAENCAQSGITGIIIPDLPVEESEPFHLECKKHGVDLIFLVAPTTTEDRMDKILSVCSGFVYVVSLAGVTGARGGVESMSKNLEELLRIVKNKTEIPVCVGFGVSKRSDVERISGFGADGVIVGSAVIDVIENHISNCKVENEQAFSDLEKFIRELKKGTMKKAEIVIEC